MSFRSPENPTVLPLLLANCVSYCNFATLLRQNEDYKKGRGCADASPALLNLMLCHGCSVIPNIKYAFFELGLAVNPAKIGILNLSVTVMSFVAFSERFVTANPVAS